MSDAPDFSGTTAVPQRHRFDEAGLAAWMAAHVDGFAGPTEVEQFKDGQSNPTYLLRTPSREYVLRRKPAGQLFRGAHAIEREARVVSALQTTGFPVPRVYGLCEDPAVIGSSFYVMERVAGRIFWDASFASLPLPSRAPMLDAMNDTLARLHRIDPASIGLADYGRTGHYIERQIARWSKQYLEDELAGRNADMDRLVDWLPAHIPAGDETSIVHGDFRVDNMIFHPTEARVIAVLDWELSTLRHPRGPRRRGPESERLARRGRLRERVLPAHGPRGDSRPGLLHRFQSVPFCGDRAWHSRSRRPGNGGERRCAGNVRPARTSRRARLGAGATRGGLAARRRLRHRR
jgi:aminoglycoside phosphotransferase (APT) family kinase protein